MIGHLFQTKLQLTAILLFLAMGVTPIALQAQTFTDLHDFNCATDGCLPENPGTVAQGQDGNLYSTLISDTVYRITPSGALTVIHNFSWGDGYEPYSGLTLGTDGDLYGATISGGSSDYGTIFKITPDGALTTLHDFTQAEGGFPYGAPVQGKNGTFYGVLGNLSKAYSITLSGAFELLRRPAPYDSEAPLVLASNGILYGTTYEGGSYGYGTVFRMSLTGSTTVIYNFDLTHGGCPYGALVQGSDGFLYGTAACGGSGANSQGVVFKLSTNGAITVLHEFDSTSTTDGFQPIGGLVAATDGNFYGTTSQGASGGSATWGTLFKITRTGTYTMLHAFDYTHGAVPLTSLAQHTNGIVYGTAEQGGADGGGVFYSLNAGIAPFVSLVGFPVGSAGQTVEILGQGLTGTTKVKFGSGSASYTVVSDTYMTATVPTSGTTGTVTVATPGGTLKSAQTYKVVPVITDFNPKNGPVGTKVTITGSGFRGAGSVAFGGVKATFTVNSGTHITTMVPSGAVTGEVKVTTKGGSATSSGTFTVT